MNSEMYFSDLNLGMIALESAILQYECENEITDDYLASDESFDEATAAAEAATAPETDDSDFAFGAGLFIETVALESEGAEGDDAKASTGEEKKESFGSKIKGALKSVLNSIGNFFKMLADKVGSVLSAIKEKIHQASLKKDAKKLSKMQSEVLRMASSVKSNVGKCIGILKKTINTNASKVKTICQDINNAITISAKDSGGAVNDDRVAAVGKEYGNDRALAKAEGCVADCEKGKEQFEKAMQILDQSVTNLLSSTAKLKIHEEAAATGPKVGESEKDAGDRIGHVAAASDKSAEDFNKKNAQTINDGKMKKVEKSERFDSMTTVTKDMVRNILLADFYANGGEVKNLTSICNDVIDTCRENQEFCSKAAAIADKVDKDNKDAKRGYALCKLYLKASNIFTYFSTQLTNLANGGYLKAAEVK